MPLNRLIIAVMALAACTRGLPAAHDDVDLLVIAPHPDDEVLLAAGVLQRAVAQGRRAAVIVMTNGDKSCERNGYVRESETVEALGLLGVEERDVHFLGYPDGSLSVLGAAPLPPVERMGPDGRCVKAGFTYAIRGAAHLDEHTARVGRPAEYTALALTDDLAALLARLRPRDVYLPHGIDDHPDHAATYAYFRRALDRVDMPAPTVHRGVIHAGPCWPGDCQAPFMPSAAIPHLPAPWETYLPRERLPVDPALKMKAISAYASQLGPVPQTDWLSSFARREEAFFPEHLVRTESGHWVRTLAPGQLPTERLVELRNSLELPLTAPSPMGFDQLELLMSNERIVLNRVEGKRSRQIGSWPRNDAEATTLQLRIDPRPDDGNISEWSLSGPDGFIGEAIVTAPAQFHSQ